MNTEESIRIIPSEAFLFFPRDEEAKNSNGVRLLFEGNIKFDEYEMKMIKEFRAYSRKAEVILQPTWTDSAILRFLQANSFKLEKTLNAVKEHSNWRTSRLPPKLTQPIQEFLEKGYLYVHGRDHKFRPIIIFNVHMIEVKTFDIELMIDTLTYFLEYIVNQLLLPGQVENWIILLDLKNMGLATLPLNPLKKLLGYLQHNYRGRLHSMYIVNTPTTIYIPFQMAKKFLEESTVNKIQFIKKQIPEPMFLHVNKEQVEEKYGGTAKNIEKYWPPVFPSKKYFVSEEEQKQLISRESYMYLFENGRLSKYKVNMELACPPLETINSEYPNRDSTSATNPVYVLSTHRADLARPSLKEFGKNDLVNEVLGDGQTTKRDQYPNKNTHLTRMVTRYTTGLETEGGDFKDLMNERLQTRGHEIPKFTYEFLVSPKFGPKNLSPKNKEKKAK